MTLIHTNPPPDGLAGMNKQSKLLSVSIESDGICVVLVYNISWHTILCLLGKLNTNN